MDNPIPRSAYGRRTFLACAIALVAAACSDSEDQQGADGQPTDNAGDSQDPDATESSADTAPTESAAEVTPGESVEPLTAASFASVAICAMAPAQGAGPFPTIEQLDRQDITEGYPGHPLRLGIRVVDGSCQPVAGARVEIWHTDATGDYSAYEDDGSGKDEGPGSTFLRGFQVAGDDGIVEFQTIYPGWYEGRAVHIHAIASVDGREVLTTQLYFDEDYTDAVHSTGEYAQFGPPDTGWDDDGIIGDPASDGTGIALTAATTSLGAGSLGLINLGVSA